MAIDEILTTETPKAPPNPTKSKLLIFGSTLLSFFFFLQGPFSTFIKHRKDVVVFGQCLGNLSLSKSCSCLGLCRFESEFVYVVLKTMLNSVTTAACTVMGHPQYKTWHGKIGTFKYPDNMERTHPTIISMIFRHLSISFILHSATTLSP